ncbi:PREDICTED: uncharacterized protein LOC106320963 [Brassica oleracea var. oleracea]|uniref:uncharacterized protein LOC106320963 n=1 Tax=Brassica oleracea var. oleracea TaxID=109376 RepID=UPI0006A7413E|nr:PREDICTED: uncharacterized protein LOC106320963 [Brassica oleracea var. oleracea]
MGYSSLVSCFFFLFIIYNGYDVYVYVSIYRLSLTLFAQHLYGLTFSPSLTHFVIMKDTKKKIPCSKKLGGYLREQKGRLYIIRRCVVMLICWSD